MKGAPRPAQRFSCYQMAVSKWWIGYSLSRIDGEHDEYFALALDVELLQPVKGVNIGHLTLYGSATDCGGFLQYDADRTLRGAI